MKKLLQSTQGEHRVSWLELFYDLVFVVVIARLAHLVTHGHNGHLGLSEFLIFIVLFIPVWWAWTGHTLYSTRFYDDSAMDRLLTLAQMFLITLLAVHITDAFQGHGQVFALIYASIRALLVIMYLRVSLLNKEMRSVSTCLATGFSLGVTLWVISAFLPTTWMYAFWIAGLLVDVTTPFLCRPALKKAGVHKHHLPERFGLLVIILLGESIASLTSALTAQELTTQVLLIALLGFVSLSAIWWHYFEVMERVIINHELGAAQLIIYGHLPIFIGLALFASAIRQNIVGHLTVSEITLLFTASLALYLIPILLIAQQSQNKYDRKILLRNTLLMILLLIVTALLRDLLVDISVSLIIATLLVLYVFLNTPKKSTITEDAQQPL